MTKDGRTLMLWGGLAGAVTVIGFGWVVMRGGTLADHLAEAKQKTGEHAKAQPAGVNLEQQVAAAQRAAKDQEKALKQTEAVLTPALKDDYTRADLTSAANRVATDLKALRQRAERTRVSLPGTLPLEAGLDPDEGIRQLQLAQLDLYRISLDTIMDAGITRISTLSPGRAWADPSGTYGILTAEIDVEGQYEALQAMLQGLLAAHAQGVGVRGLTITPGARADAPMRARLTTSLIIKDLKPEWKLVPDKTAPLAPKAAVGKAPTAAPKPVTVSTKPTLGDD